MIDRHAATRRRLIKLLAAGIAAPAVLRTTGALAAYPDRVVRIVRRVRGTDDVVAPERVGEVIAWLRAAAQDAAQVLVLTHPR